MDGAFEAKAISILAVSALALLVVVTGGIVYLTAAEWRDRRRRSKEATPSAAKKRK
ncbi:hypothetical protein IQ241_09315 [Romeria aff. gracilis LEGE 07310]|uniref:Uncharacterized protein n=1 Tax=Vasconcelosia minhoensis LEGE 07310 TaxID=915328 RepID=A0A8J7DR08_9CYAN|nr:hypothetical protein [Romeria gracilis]MBE9077494.1 hypothetical protein [Romeria aff. gracilis LEGE 07310]